jgi:nicotinamidase-related amidase
MNTALLIIDVQQALFDVEPQPFEADIVVQRINSLSQGARTLGIPVVFVQHEKEGTPLAFQSEGWQLHRSIITGTGDHFIRKTTPDSFLRTPLKQTLNEFGVIHVVVCGYASEFCVDTTVRRAAALGYSVTLVADAHTTCDKHHAGGAEIRAHENATLPNISSFGPVIKAIKSEGITFAV